MDGYRLVRPLGRGGMGEVYLAHDGLLDRPVAIKFVAEVDAETRRRFLVEGRAIARLQHPNVVSVYRVGEHEGRPYLVSEYVQGRTLDRVSLPLAWDEALRIGLEVARGLSVAHRRGVVHRDIKPANVILADDGAVKILDFGIARLVGPTDEVPDRPPTGPLTLVPDLRSLVEDDTPDVDPMGATSAPSGGELSLTRPGAMLGTPAYMAPEIWRGQAATFAADVYSLGALLFALCTGRPPFVADSFLAMREIVLRGERLPLLRVAPGVDPGFAEVIERCLAPDPADRYASANELRAALTRLTPTARADVLPEGNPYRGLHAFETEHRDLFFGRDSEIRMLLDRLRAEPFVLVVGDSGTGKSSLCRAGVLPRVGGMIEGRAWSAVTVVPGRHPVTALAAALAPLLEADERELAAALRDDACDFARRLRGALGDARGVVLFVDQLEELVTLAEPDERAALTDALSWLIAPSPSVRVLGTVRGDFLSRIATLPRIGDIASRALFFLRPLSEERISEVIVGPAQALGVRYESPALVEALVRGTLGGGGGLPLLQFALQELWNARPAGTEVITAKVLEDIGGVTGALTRHADGVLAQMLPESRAAARQVLLRLVTADETRAVRSEVELGAGEPRARAALDALIRGRLVVARDTPEGPSYEIAHEALIRGWSTLARWLTEDEDARLVRERLRTAVAEWERLGRAREALWSRRQLVEAGALADLAERERRFLDASRRAWQLARGLRLAALLLPVLLTGGVYVSMRIRAAHDLSAHVDAELSAAEAAITDARDRRERAAKLRDAALAAFDGPDVDKAEADWAEARAAMDEVQPAYAQGAQHLEAALQLDPRRPDVRGLFADVLYERALLAESLGDRRAVYELLQRLSVYDPHGTLRARWNAPGRLNLTLDPPNARVELRRYVQRGGGPPAEEPATAGDPLRPGTYLIEVSAPGRATVRDTFVVRRDTEVRLSIALPPSVPEGYAYVPPGRFQIGSAAEDGLRRDFFHTVPLHEVTTGGYLIAKHETTFAEWIAYLEALPPDERARRTPHLGKGGFNGELSLSQLPDGRWRLAFQPSDRIYSVTGDERLVYPARKTHREHDWRRLPVVAVGLEDVRAYTDWLDRTGRLPGARLCTGAEWERAGRGADGREYPNGAARLDADDANVDATYGKDPSTMGPDEVGSHPATRSPYGVDDLAGNVWEWTRSAPGSDVFPARGGSFNFGPNTARLTGREVTESSFRDVSVGLRVCADFPAKGP